QEQPHPRHRAPPPAPRGPRRGRVAPRYPSGSPPARGRRGGAASLPSVACRRSPLMLDDATRQRIDALIASAPVVLFMKGTRRQPQCGFSATVVRILDELIPEYATVDVLADPAIREGIKVYSSWPTIPQLYVKGEFLGGCDIVKELYGSGELHEKLGLPVPERRVPTLHVTDAAAA